ncbi:hypothetical protein GCM10023172_27010 [Hymenobacter ginsengisoli]|uniref:Uncharacterized protein n=1 Tax=Hymenobacter ginsengisoli TaxID=1051626 RepID=A0ABP8QH23_9BACT
MAGAKSAHSRLCFNPAAVLGTQLDGSPCEGYTTTARVLNASSYLHANLSAVCGEAEFNRSKTPENLLTPTLMVEVSSASTAGPD